MSTIHINRDDDEDDKWSILIFDTIVVPRHRRYFRPRTSRRKALLDPEPRSRRNGHNLDPMVFRHHPQEHAVRRPLSLFLELLIYANC